MSNKGVRYKDDDERLEARLAIRLTNEEVKALEEAATELGCTKAKFVRRAINDLVKKTLTK